MGALLGCKYETHRHDRRANVRYRWKGSARKARKKQGNTGERGVAACVREDIDDIMEPAGRMITQRGMRFEILRDGVPSPALSVGSTMEFIKHQGFLGQRQTLGCCAYFPAVGSRSPA